MIRTFLIATVFATGAWANDIYVAQTNEDNKAALETPVDNTATGSTYQQPESGSNFEKSLIPVDSAQYCSVMAGCFTKD